MFNRKGFHVAVAFVTGMALGLFLQWRAFAGAGEGAAVASDPVVSWLTIGGSTKDASTRRVGWDLKRRGWGGFVRLVVRPQIDWGCRRFVLHNPFGTLPGEPMQFDQYMHARDAGLTWLCEGFVEAWRPVTEEGIEVICYLGKLRDDPDFEELRKRGKYDDWLARAWASLQPALDAGMSIALDASSRADAGHPVYKLAELLRSLGVKVYIEPRPPITHNHWFDYPVVTTEQFWHRSNPEKHISSLWAARDDQLRGEIIRMITRTPQADQPEKAREVIAEGHTAALYVLGMIREGVSRESLFSPQAK